MKTALGRRKRLIPALVVGVHLLFLLETALPAVAWCHKADGGTELEFEAADSICPCEACQQSRQMNLLERVGRNNTGLLLEAASCTHEPIPSEVFHSSSFSPHHENPAAVPVVALGTVVIRETILAGPALGPGMPLVLTFDPSPPGGGVLRC